MSRWGGSRWNFRFCTEGGGGGGGGTTPLMVDLILLEPDPIELGAELVNPTFNANTAGGDPLTLKELLDTDGNPATDILGAPNPVTKPFTYTRTAIGGFVDFTLRADDGNGIVTDTERHNWAPRVYLGSAVPAAVDEAFIEALAESELRIADKGIARAGIAWGTGERLYVAFPSGFGPADPLDFLVQIGGSGFPGGFEEDPASPVSVTPNTPNGVPLNYDVWRSVGTGLGLSVDVTVSP